MAIARPSYAHDCTECIYLGSHRAHDLYYCVRLRPTVLARYGSNAPDYVSGLEVAKVDPILAEAVRRAGQLGRGGKVAS